jgi:hypothetical protein
MSRPISDRELHSDRDEIRRRSRFAATDAVVEEFRGAPLVDPASLQADLDAVADQSAEPRS